jgi:hypothetical protein
MNDIANKSRGRLPLSAYRTHSARLCLSPVVALCAIELRQPSLAVAHRRPVPAFVGSPFGSRTQAVQCQRSKKTVASLIAQLSQDEAAATALPTAETSAGAGRGDWLVLRSLGAVIAELLLIGLEQDPQQHAGRPVGGASPAAMVKAAPQDLPAGRVERDGAPTEADRLRRLVKTVYLPGNAMPPTRTPDPGRLDPGNPLTTARCP